MCESNKTYISNSEDSISVYHQDGHMISTGSVCKLPGPNSKWYISRVNVHHKLRGKGIGTSILDKLIKAVMERQDRNDIVVTPGGYNEDPERQYQFYKKYGFVDHGNPFTKDGPDVLIYKRIII